MRSQISYLTAAIVALSACSASATTPDDFVRTWKVKHFTCPPHPGQPPPGHCHIAKGNILTIEKNGNKYDVIDGQDKVLTTISSTAANTLEGEIELDHSGAVLKHWLKLELKGTGNANKPFKLDILVCPTKADCDLVHAGSGHGED